MSVRSVEPGLRHLDGEEPYPGTVDAIGVDPTTSRKGQGARLPNENVSAPVFFIDSLKEKAKMRFLVRMRRHPKPWWVGCLCKAEASGLAHTQEISSARPVGAA